MASFTVRTQTRTQARTATQSDAASTHSDAAEPAGWLWHRSALVPGPADLEYSGKWMVFSTTSRIGDGLNQHERRWAMVEEAIDNGTLSVGCAKVNAGA